MEQPNHVELQGVVERCAALKQQLQVEEFEAAGDEEDDSEIVHDAAAEETRMCFMESGDQSRAAMATMQVKVRTRTSS